MDENDSGKYGLGLYLHIPFCVKKCGYCDFLSAPAASGVKQAYVSQMLREIHAVAKAYQGYFVDTIFVGGGTPSCLQGQQISLILEAVHNSFAVCADAEATIECNPGTLDAGKLHAYAASGINRLSIGFQSADESELRLLGRIHTYQQAVANYRLARDIGFQNINIDLIAALPGQKASTYGKTLQSILALKPDHISAYGLMIEEGTPFYSQYGQAEQLRQKGEPQQQLPSEEEERDMYEMTKTMLQSAGYCRYEISNYARGNAQCRHNIRYWTRKYYLGIGLGAASMVDNIRFSNPANLDTYLNLDFENLPPASNTNVCMEWHEKQVHLDKQAQMEEFMFLGLRMACGVSAKQFYRQFSQSIEDVYGAAINRHLEQKLLKKTEAGYCLTDYGIDVSNYVMAGYLL